MDRERAETFLRLLVEAELRRLTEQPGDLAVQAGCITRVIRVVRVLTAVRADDLDTRQPRMLARHARP
jgi:hypothetical protein